MINFDEMIDNFLFRESRPKKEGRYYPSEIGSCLRKVWYSYRYPQELKPDLIKIFEVGNIMHDFITEVLKSERNPHIELLKAELPVKTEIDDFTISGRIDDLLLIKENGKSILVEVKSVKSVAYQQRPSHNHIMQLQFYMFVTNIHSGILLYIDKTTLQTKAFEINYDEATGRQIIERFRRLHNALKNNKLPPDEAKLLDEMNWMCRFCEYREKCDRNEI
jgi:CRISPR/Cas system-associated exonuclease Cas4 (RecB family)